MHVVKFKFVVYCASFRTRPTPQEDGTSPERNLEMGCSEPFASLYAND